MSVHKICSPSESHSLAQAGIVLFGLRGRKIYAAVVGGVSIVTFHIHQNPHPFGKAKSLRSEKGVVGVVSLQIGNNADAECSRALRAGIGIVEIITFKINNPSYPKKAATQR